MSCKPGGLTITMMDVQNAIDCELEAAKTADIYSRSTQMLYGRMEALTGKQLEIRDILASIDAQVKEAEQLQVQHHSSAMLPVASGNTATDTGMLMRTVPFVNRVMVRQFSNTSGIMSNISTILPRSQVIDSGDTKMVAGAKDSPIVIDDEESSSQQQQQQAMTTQHSSDVNKAAAPVHNTSTTFVQLLPTPAQQDLLDNARRRPLIVEKMTHGQISETVTLSGTVETIMTPSDQSSSTVVSPMEQDEPLSSDILPSSKSLPLHAPEKPVSHSMPENNTSSIAATVVSSVTQEESMTTTTNLLEDSNFNFNTSDFLSTNKDLALVPERKLRSKEVQQANVLVPAADEEQAHSPCDFQVGSRVLGKRSSDIWFPGEIVKTISDKNKQVKYSVKYDKGQKGVLSLNHICPEAPATARDISVGSRVVGLYGRLDIWYAGIAAEMPCIDNKNRFLVFFDDGFAQYLSPKKLHIVHHKGKNVWEDVAEHSRDFIQEYLEDYPSRPMLHVRVGQWIRTEWLGQWLKAKVLSVDGSLVKMLFQIDNRSEWIYRGSTRLDPLYRALVLGEKTTSGKARSRKLTRNVTARGNTPYIEYNLTKASFGISPYSKTDPQGVQQLQLEEQRKITQLQQQPYPQATPTSTLTSMPTSTTTSMPTSTTTTASTAKSSENAAVQTKKHVPTVEIAPLQEESKAVSKSVEERKETTFTARNVAHDVITLDAEISSTYSCIEASTIRKRTGASLVNYNMFKSEAMSEPLKVNTPPPNPPAELLPSTPILLSLKPPRESPPPTSIPPLFLKPPGGSLPPATAPRNRETQENQSVCQGGSWVPPWLKFDNKRNKQRHQTEHVFKPDLTGQTSKPRDVASILKTKLDSNIAQETIDEEMPAVLGLERARSVTGPHTCSTACQRKRASLVDLARHNPLAVPLMVNWRREIVKRRGKTNKRDVYYRTPCDRRLRNMAEVFSYLRMTNETMLNIDQFSFDWRLRTRDMPLARPIIMDVSNGLENRPLPAVNEVDTCRPPDVQYISARQLAPEVPFSRDPGFMVCCDCQDDCSDSSKCACIQLTLRGCKAIEGKDCDKATYQYRRLQDCLQTGIYECNSRCSCTKRCLNKVVQNGIQMRMEIFKTENRGWGLRAVDDIPAGTFICTYAGFILNEDLANQEGRDYGDEYMAELDYIEVAERAKEGYESGVSDLEEDDNVITEMLEFDENLSGSELSITYEDDSPSHDVIELDDDEEMEEEAEASSSDCSISSGDDFGQRKKTLRSRKPKMAYNESQQKKSGTISEESLVVERESKASVLSTLKDQFMCILALKRNENDLRKSGDFLKQLAGGEVLKTDNGAMMNGEVTGVDGKPCDVQSDADFDFDDFLDDKVSAINNENNTSNNNGKERSSGAKVEQTNDCGVDVVSDEQHPVQCLDAQDLSTVDNKEDVPELLSADDLKRLAASQPKSDEPPVLLKAGEGRRDTVLSDTIEKLKKRVEILDATNSPNCSKALLSKSSMDVDDDDCTVSQKCSSTPETTSLSSECVKDRDDTSVESAMAAVASSGLKSNAVNVLGETEQNEDDEKSSVRSSSCTSSVVTHSSRSSTPAATPQLIDLTAKDDLARKDKEGRKEDLIEMQAKAIRTRSLFGEEHCYVIDAKTFGNCGRFLNHSCTPNLFVQNVFVDTHDLRFPWVAFFAQHTIKAGSELNWDYMYEVGSVRDKVLHCLCGSTECRGRLL